MFFAPSKSRQRAKIQNMGISKTNDHIQIKIKIPNPSQKLPASSKAPNEDLKNMDDLCTLKSKMERESQKHGFIKVQRPYPNQDPDVKPKSGTSGILQSFKSGLAGHRCYLHLQNQDREPKLVYQRPETLSRLGSRCQTPVRNLQDLTKPKSGLKVHMFFAHSK